VIPRMKNDVLRKQCESQHRNILNIMNDGGNFLTNVILLRCFSILFFLLHPRDYYKLTFCVNFSNIFDNL